MNPLKTLFNKVFESTPPEPAENQAKDDAAFEWNPDEETVAPTSSAATSWKRGDAEVEATRVAPDRPAVAPILEPRAKATVPPIAAPSTPASTPVPPASEPTPFVSLRAAPVVSETPPSAKPDPGVKPLAPELPAAPASSSALVNTPPQIPLSDFEDVYRKAGIKSPVHGYGVERVYRLLTSRRLAGLDRNVRRSALLTALDAAGVPASDVSQDAVLRRKALTAYEAEKALELQSLRSRNESRAEALQDTVETFTRQKQSQIERLAQGSTSAVRSQSDLEIRKRMEQDRLFRSLAYFVEPLPSPSFSSEPRPALRSEAARMIERFDATIEMNPPREEAPAPPPTLPPPPPPVAETKPEPTTPKAPVVTEAPAKAASGTPPAVPAPVVPAPAVAEPVAQAETPAPAPTVPAEAVPVRPPTDAGADTRPMTQSSLEMALRAAAEEARTAGWGKAALVEDKATDPVDALKKLREAKKTESES